MPKVMWGQRARRLKRIRGRWRLCSWTLKSSQGSNTQAGYTTFLLFSLNYLNYLAYISKTSLLLVYCMILGAGQGRVWVIKQFTDSLFLISFILVSLCQWNPSKTHRDFFIQASFFIMCFPCNSKEKETHTHTHTYPSYMDGNHTQNIIRF